MIWPNGGSSSKPPGTDRQPLPTAQEAYFATALIVNELLDQLPDDAARSRYLWITIKDMRTALFRIMQE